MLKNECFQSFIQTIVRHLDDLITRIHRPLIISIFYCGAHKALRTKFSNVFVGDAMARGICKPPLALTIRRVALFPLHGTLLVWTCTTIFSHSSRKWIKLEMWNSLWIIMLWYMWMSCYIHPILWCFWLKALIVG